MHAFICLIAPKRGRVDTGSTHAVLIPRQKGCQLQLTRHQGLEMQDNKKVPVEGLLQVTNRSSLYKNEVGPKTLS